MNRKRGPKTKPDIDFQMVRDPEYIVNMARRRCAFMLKSLNMIDYDLTRLVVSAYLQGVHDAGVVSFNNGFVPPGCEPPAGNIWAGDGI
jgi:hypothetical protein